jgi:hypothetical protein
MQEEQFVLCKASRHWNNDIKWVEEVFEYIFRFILCELNPHQLAKRSTLLHASPHSPFERFFALPSS